MLSKKGSRGFTLLELLISLTIVAIIVVIVFGALRIGIRAWEKGEKDVEARQRQRIVLDLVRHQLASICVSDVRDRNNQPVLMKGDGKSVEFVSHIPLTPGNRFGLVYAKYAVKQEAGDENERLAFYEKNLLLLDSKNIAGLPDESEFSDLLSGMKSIVFEYLNPRPGEEKSLWQQTWDPDVDKGVPRAVRITLKENDDRAPVYVIAATAK